MSTKRGTRACSQKTADLGVSRVLAEGLFFADGLQVRVQAQEAKRAKKKKALRVRA